MSAMPRGLSGSQSEQRRALWKANVPGTSRPRTQPLVREVRASAEAGPSLSRQATSEADSRTCARSRSGPEAGVRTGAVQPAASSTWRLLQAVDASGMPERRQEWPH